MKDFNFKAIYQQLISEDLDFRRDAIGKLYVAYEKKLKRNLQFKYPFIDSLKLTETKEKSPFLEDIIQIAFFKIIEKKLIPQSEYAIVGWMKSIVNKTASEEINRFWRKFEVNESTQSDSAGKLENDFYAAKEELNRLSELNKKSEKIKSKISRLKVKLVGIVKAIQDVNAYSQDGDTSSEPYVKSCMDEAILIFGLQYPEEASILMEHKVGLGAENKKPNSKSLEEIAASFQLGLSNTKKIVTTYAKLLNDSLLPCLE